MNIKKIISIILFVVATIMISFGFYYLNSSKNIFSKILSKSLDYAVNTIYSDDFKIDGVNFDNAKLTTNTSMEAMNIELLKLTGDLYINSNEIYIDADSKLLGEDFVSVAALVNTSKAYFKAEDIIDKFYYIDLTKSDIVLEDTNVQLEKNELEILTKYFKESILKDLKDDDFEKNSENLIINNNKYKTNRLSLTLSDKEVSNIVISFVENIMNDPEIIQILQKIKKEITQQGIKEWLDEYKKNTAIAAKDEKSLEISFYISGISDVIRMEFMMFDNDTDSGISSNRAIIIDNYKDNSNQKVTNIVYKENNKDLITYSIKKISNSTKEIILSYNELAQPFIIKGSYTKFSSSLDTYFELFVSNQKICDVSYEINTINKNKEYEIKLESNVGENHINSVNRLYLEQTMPNVNVGNATKYEDMSQEEQEMFNNFINDKLTELGLNNNNTYEDEG